MFRNITNKTLYERRWMILFWFIGIAATAVLTMALYPSFDQQGVDQIVNSVPDSLKALVGNADNYRTVSGWIAQQIYGPQIPIFLMVLTIVLFIGIGAGDEDRGILQSILVQPVSRSQVYIQKLLAGLIILAVSSLAVAVGTWLGLVIIGDHFSMLRLAQATVMCWLMIVDYGLVAYCAGMASGKKGLAIGVASGYAFGSFMISSLAPASKSLHLADRFSFFHYYNQFPVSQDGIHWSDFGVLLAVAVVLVILGLLAFRQRDISS